MIDEADQSKKEVREVYGHSISSLNQLLMFDIASRTKLFLLESAVRKYTGNAVHSLLRGKDIFNHYQCLWYFKFESMGVVGRMCFLN